MKVHAAIQAQALLTLSPEVPELLRNANATNSVNGGDRIDMKGLEVLRP